VILGVVVGVVVLITIIVVATRGSDKTPTPTPTPTPLAPTISPTPAAPATPAPASAVSTENQLGCVDGDLQSTGGQKLGKPSNVTHAAELARIKSMLYFAVSAESGDAIAFYSNATFQNQLGSCNASASPKKHWTVYKVDSPPTNASALVPTKPGVPAPMRRQ
jgi:hypothetical protein